MSGPGGSGMWSSVKSSGPRLPPLFSHTSILPEPGVKTFTQSLKSANLKLFHVWLMGGVASSWVIIASTWSATGMVWPKRMQGFCASGGGGGATQAVSHEAVSL